MNIQSLSKQYAVRKILNAHIPDVVKLCDGNPLYYQHCPPAVSAAQIKADLSALPPNKTYQDKYYIGFYNSEILVAVMDLICKYPDDETAFIGFFMTNSKLQGAGVGTNIITECLQGLKSMGYKQVRLGYVKDNPQAKAFWKKNHFIPTGAETIQERYTVVSMQKQL